MAFLIADFSGQALIRLGHGGAEYSARTQGRETAELVSLAGSPHGRAVLTQTAVVEAEGEGTRLFARSPGSCAERRIDTRRRAETHPAWSGGARAA